MRKSNTPNELSAAGKKNKRGSVIMTNEEKQLQSEQDMIVPNF